MSNERKKEGSRARSSGTWDNFIVFGGLLRRIRLIGSFRAMCSRRFLSPGKGDRVSAGRVTADPLTSIVRKTNAGPSTRPGAPGLAQDDRRVLLLMMTAFGWGSCYPTLTDSRKARIGEGGAPVFRAELRAVRTGVRAIPGPRIGTRGTPCCGGFAAQMQVLRLVG
jgi:hypothetical protein